VGNDSATTAQTGAETSVYAVNQAAWRAESRRRYALARPWSMFLSRYEKPGRDVGFAKSGFRPTGRPLITLLELLELLGLLELLIPNEPISD